VERMRAEVAGRRADAVPAVFTHITMTFVVSGDVAQNKRDRAVALSLEKYCSVAKMLGPAVVVEGRGRIEGCVAWAREHLPYERLPRFLRSLLQSPRTRRRAGAARRSDGCRSN